MSGPAEQAAEAVRRGVGHVSQVPLSASLTRRVGDEVALELELRRWPRADMRARGAEVLGRLGLADFERRPIATLSDGERRLLALALAIAPRPGLLLLDEPTAHLDLPARRRALAMIGELVASREQTVVIVDRHAGELIGRADLVLVLDAEGRQVARTRPERLPAGALNVADAQGAWLPRAQAADGGVALAERRRPRAPAQRHPLLVAEALSVPRTPRRARGGDLLRDIHLRLDGGMRVGLRSANGGGATSLLLTLAGLRRGGGVVALGDGSSAPVAPPHRLAAGQLARLIGYMPPEPRSMIVGRTCGGDVIAGTPYARRDRAMRAELEEVLDRFGLGRFANRRPASLSYGEQRRLNLCAVSWRAPGVLLLDQPEVGLDRRGVEMLTDLLDELRELGQAQLLVTHDEGLLSSADEILELADSAPAGRP